MWHSNSIIYLQIAAYFLLLVSLGMIGACDSGVAKDLGLGVENIDANEAEIAADMTQLIISVSQKRAAEGNIRRFNQAKSIGCVNAKFEVYRNLPEYLQQGLFSTAKQYKALVRFANASKDDDGEKDLRGMSIKVHGVSGKSLWGESGTQDFLLNSYPALFAAAPDDFLAFIRAIDNDRIWWYFVNPLDLHLGSLWILIKARQQHTSPLDITYWSTTPFRFGDEPTRAVKYAVRSCSDYHSRIPDDPSPDFLRQNMKRHLQQEPACMEFMVQMQKDAKRMPVEDASVIWDEDVSPFIPVARITIADQPFTDAQALAACERVSFNPWQSLAAHRPIGGINRVRKDVYAQLAEFRLGL